MSSTPTQTQISAGGVAFRYYQDQLEIAIISVGTPVRWQLPKGSVDEGETHEITAQREVREEAGITTELIESIDKIEYWYYSKTGIRRIRFHKFVYFFLMRYLSGDVADHDQEVNEARWVEIDQAISMLAFSGEKNIVKRAKEMIHQIGK
jgi:8-oxo-dGTP diphosphatase